MNNITLPRMFGQQLNLGHWSTDGLAFLWRGIPAGNVVDESFFKNHGTITGATWIGNGLKFDGVDTIVNTPSFNLGSTLTIVVEVRLDISLSGNMDVCYKRSGTSLIDFWLVWESSQKIRLYVGGSGGSNFALSTTVFEVGETYQVVGVYDGTDTKIYINGKWEDDAPIPLAPDGGLTPMYFGQGFDVNRFLDGGISHVIIYNRALAASEIQALSINPDLPIKQDPVWLGAVISAPAGTTPKGPLTHPLYGPFAGPIAC